MKIIKNTATLTSLFMMLSIPVMGADEDDEFTKFKNQQVQGINDLQNEFEEYKKQLEAGFAAYKKAYKDAYNANKKEISNIWGDYRPGDKKRWVEYDKGNLRKSVNFESGHIELEMLVDKEASNKKVEKELKNNILSLLKTTEKQAFENDKVAQAVEKKMQANPLVKSSPVSNKPVLAPLVPQVKSAAPVQLQKLSKQYAKKAATDVRPAKVKGKKIVRVKFTVPPDAPEKAKPFLPTAKKIVEKEKLPLPLVMAVMEAESAFNPLAKSHIPAYGLMQIVPQSAGQDATAYLFGKAKILSPSYLYNSDNNIEIGGAYLHILYFRYLKNIENPVSRLYCAIAAYNTGAGNVARAFIGSTNIGRASKTINKLTPKQVYQKLRKNLPYEETQKYVKKVSLKMQKYQKI